MQHVLFDGITVQAMLSGLGGGLGVALVAQLTKRFLKLKNSKVIMVLVAALSVIGAYVAYAMSKVHSNGAVLGTHSAELLGIANVWHELVVSDVEKWVNKVRSALNVVDTGEKKAEGVVDKLSAPASETTSEPDF